MDLYFIPKYRIVEWDGFVTACFNNISYATAIVMQSAPYGKARLEALLEPNSRDTHPSYIRVGRVGDLRRTLEYRMAWATSRSRLRGGLFEAASALHDEVNRVKGY